jgi:hypothetical protein
MSRDTASTSEKVIAVISATGGSGAGTTRACGWGDYDLWLRLAARGARGVHPRRNRDYRIHPDQTSRRSLAVSPLGRRSPMAIRGPWNSSSTGLCPQLKRGSLGSTGEVASEGRKRCEPTSRYQVSCSHLSRWVMSFAWFVGGHCLSPGGPYRQWHRSSWLSSPVRWRYGRGAS